MYEYFGNLSKVISEFETKLSQLDKDHMEINKIKENVEQVQELMAKGNIFANVRQNRFF